MSDSATVCVVGSANVDLTFRAARLPGTGETIAARSFAEGCGGKGANQAVMAARLGARVCLIGSVGADAFGRMLLDNLRTNGVDTDFVRIDPSRPTGVAAVVVDDEGRNCIVVADGANGALTPDDVRNAATSVRTASVLLCQLETPLETTLEAFRIARATGVRTVLNPAPARPLPEELLRLTDLCVPNETEATLLTGVATDTLDGAAAAARSLHRRGPRAVIVTLGSRGCLVDEGHGAEHFPARPVAAVDSTGAGDAFLGALASALASGAGLRDAVPIAAAAATLSVTRPGAQTSFPTRGEVDFFIARGPDSSNRAAQDGHGESSHDAGRKTSR
jgi:ribokinase